MNINTETSDKKKYYLEAIKWLIILILLIALVIGNYIYADADPLVKTTLTIFSVILIITIGLTTTQGKLLLIFAREAKIEIYKVIWPSRQETFYTTLIVILVTIIMSLILWGLDSILVRLVSFITNLRL